MARRTKRTPKRDEKFFLAVSEGMTIGAACMQANYARRSVYEYRQKDTAFAALWTEADDTAVERMEAEADRRAIIGVREPVFHKGEVCGAIRKFSDVLLIFRLKAKRPAMYRDRASVEHSGPDGGPIQTHGVLVSPGIQHDKGAWNTQSKAHHDPNDPT